MPSSLYITAEYSMELPDIAYYLSKHFKTEVVAIEEKTTYDIRDIYIVQFAHVLPENMLNVFWEHGEYRFWPEPNRMLHLYLANPNTIQSEQFITQCRYVVATGDKYYRLLNNEDSTCYIENKRTHKHIPISENPFVF